MLSLEAPPAVEAVSPQNVQAVITPQAQPASINIPSEPPATVQEKTPANYDMALKEEILKAAHEKDFVLFCGLFDIMPYLDNGKLMLDVQHSYSFNRLCVDTNKSALAEMFESYGKVCLQHKGEIVTCKTVEQLLAGEKEPAQPSEKEQISTPAAENLTDNHAEPEEQTSQQENILRRETSPFEKYRQTLTQLGAEPEILFIKHLESDSQDDTPSQEGDTDNDNDE